MLWRIHFYYSKISLLHCWTQTFFNRLSFKIVFSFLKNIVDGSCLVSHKPECYWKFIFIILKILNYIVEFKYLFIRFSFNFLLIWKIIVTSRDPPGVLQRSLFSRVDLFVSSFESKRRGTFITPLTNWLDRRRRVFFLGRSRDGMSLSSGKRLASDTGLSTTDSQVTTVQVKF